VKSIPIGGGSINPIAQNQGAPDGIAVDAQYVYWTNYDDNTVLKAPKAGGTAYTLASSQNNPSAIAVDDKNVYWANQGSGYILKVAK
jgi:sugar lactone lactonase YvrE